LLLYRQENTECGHDAFFIIHDTAHEYQTLISGQTMDQQRTVLARMTTKTLAAPITDGTNKLRKEPSLGAHDLRLTRGEGDGRKGVS
jgi:hypothetical protein